MKVTKEVKLIFGVSRMRYEIHLPAGLRVRKIEGDGTKQYFLSEFPINSKPPFTSFPIDSFIRHDAIHYGIRLNENQVQDRKEIFE